MIRRARERQATDSALLPGGSIVPDWRTKAAIMVALSLMPGGHRLNYEFQRVARGPA
jgi:hypothetical protein